MGLPHSLSDEELLVLDTSVVINLNATGCAEEILRALPQRIVVLDVVVDELNEGRPKGRRDAERFMELIKGDLVAMAVLAEHGLPHFEGLVMGTGPETLDDGEAATIAHALDKGGRAIVDERKAIRICTARFPQLRLGCTVDLLAHPAVHSVLGASRLANAVHTALRDARMRVLPHHMNWVVALIGDTRASECRCLPDVTRRQAQARL